MAGPESQQSHREVLRWTQERRGPNRFECISEVNKLKHKFYVPGCGRYAVFTISESISFKASSELGGPSTIIVERSTIESML